MPDTEPYSPQGATRSSSSQQGDTDGLEGSEKSHDSTVPTDVDQARTPQESDGRPYPFPKARHAPLVSHGTWTPNMPVQSPPGSPESDFTRSMPPPSTAGDGPPAGSLLFTRNPVLDSGARARAQVPNPLTSYYTTHPHVSGHVEEWISGYHRAPIHDAAGFGDSPRYAQSPNAMHMHGDEGYRVEVPVSGCIVLST
ncbi:hypothetical protein BV20DRAFT_579210 [Pilatotrama ljubarskyi]|nr:hypothetical protein BV20DRAFT_579210 [Pilatotrama ljubarskyi]